jgi:uncharacterized protein
MRLEEYSEEKLKKEIVEIISKYLDLNKYKVFFFGSRVRGDNFERADIDLGIEGPAEISAKIMLEIKEELENIRMLYKIDLVDFKTVSEKFKKEALKYIEYVK